MTCNEAKAFVGQIADLRNTWATDSNATPAPTQTRLYELCEAFIEAMDDAIGSVTTHPDPPVPRVR